MRRINSLPCETAMPSIIIEFNHEIFVIIFWRTIGTAEDAHEKTTWFEKETHSHIKFYHNWAISGVLIGWQLCLIRVQCMEKMWWCCNFFFSLSRMHVSWETSTKWASNLSILWQKTICTVLLIDIKMFKNLQWNHLPFHLSFEHVDVISMVDKSTDCGKFLSIR